MLKGRACVAGVKCALLLVAATGAACSQQSNQVTAPAAVGTEVATAGSAGAELNKDLAAVRRPVITISIRQ